MGSNKQFATGRGVLYRYMRNPDNDAFDMAVNGSVTPVNYRFTCPPNRNTYLSRILINLCTLTTPIGSDFGDIANGLTNGMAWKLHDANGSVMVDLTDGNAIKQNRIFGVLAGPDWSLATAQGGDGAVTVRWTFSKAGRAIKLTPGQYIQTVVQDDLTSLPSAECMLQGYFLDVKDNPL